MGITSPLGGASPSESVSGGHRSYKLKYIDMKESIICLALFPVIFFKKSFLMLPIGVYRESTDPNLNTCTKKKVN